MPSYRSCRGFVYVMHNQSMPSLVKIGMTHDCSYLRAKALSNTSVPYAFKVILNIESESALELEQKIHAELSKDLIAKEFFRIPKKEAVKLVTEISLKHDCTSKISDASERKTRRSSDKMINGAPLK